MEPLSKEGFAAFAASDPASEVLDSYRVRNAIIVASDRAEHIAPLSFERPTALFELRGELLIERLIRQLNEAGVEDIVILVGYRKESFFYLSDRPGVRIVVDAAYYEHGRSSLYGMMEYLGNSYVLGCSQYLEENPFRSLEFESYYVPVPARRREASFSPAAGEAGGKLSSSSYRLRGLAYVSRESAQAISRALALVGAAGVSADAVVDASMLGRFGIVPRKPPAGMRSFDSLEDLLDFDADFLVNVDSSILDNICRVLDCSRADITKVAPVKAGLTNMSVLFVCRGEKYIYRYPGFGTEEVVCREAEAFALSIAADLGLDRSLLHVDAGEGWKISRYLEGCRPFDSSDDVQVKEAFGMIRRLHESGAGSPWSFDFHKEAARIGASLKEGGYPLPSDYASLARRVSRLDAAMAADRGEPCLCHNDFYGPNLLVSDEGMQLIDWEYSAMGDYACDLAGFFAQEPGYDLDRVLRSLRFYFGRPPTPEERRHCVSAVGVVGFYWFTWAMLKESKGARLGDCLFAWYKAARDFSAAGLRLYGLEPEEGPFAEGREA